MDAFYASVEQRDDPSLRGRPVVVGGNPKSRGVVATASYEARQYGIHSAMPTAHAYRLCPSAVFVKPRMAAYREVSQRVRKILHDYTDLVEPMGFDEAYLDVTENKKAIPSATWVARDIRAEIAAVTGLTASAGVSFNKFLAKIASDLDKPDGLSVITRDRAPAFIDGLEVRKFHGIGKSTAARLAALGIFTGADLRARSEIELVRAFGKSGSFYYRIVRGDDPRPICPLRVRKSVGVERTFGTDVVGLPALESILATLSQTAAERLGSAGTSGKTLTLKIRFNDFRTLTRSRTERTCLHGPEALCDLAIGLLREIPEAAVSPVRLLGLSVSNLDTHDEAGDRKQPELPFDSNI